MVYLRVRKPNVDKWRLEILESYGGKLMFNAVAIIFLFFLCKNVKNQIIDVAFVTGRCHSPAAKMLAL